MKNTGLWSKETNPVTGAKFEAFAKYLDSAHNGDMDLNWYINSEYGDEMARRLNIRFTYEDDASGEAAAEFYRSIGLKREVFEDEDYYTRWVMLAPLSMYAAVNGYKRYPLVVSLHGSGSSVETDEFSTGYNYIAGKEEFIVIYPQNTNWENTARIINLAKERFPVDAERIYVSGFSQGCYQVNGLQFRHPELLAGAALCGSDIYRPWDNFDIPYTQNEINSLKNACVPLIQMVGAVEASSFVPLTRWRPRRNVPNAPTPETHFDPRMDHKKDPTHLKDGKWWTRSTAPTPPEGVNVAQFMLDRVNKRMWLLSCPPREYERCVSFETMPYDELHHTLGIYGDREKTDIIYGYKHYTVDIDSFDGIKSFRYICVENSPHWPYAAMGECCWNFFKQFRRDGKTGKIVQS